MRVAARAEDILRQGEYDSAGLGLGVEMPESFDAAADEVPEEHGRLGVVDDGGEEFGHVETGGPDHLGNERCAGHARNRVDLEEVESLLRMVNVVDAHKTLAAEAGINLRRSLLNESGFLIRNRCRTDFIAVAVVFCVVVEVVVLADDFNDGESHDAILAGVGRAGEFPSGNTLFDNHGLAFGIGEPDSLGESRLILNLCNAE